MRLTESELFTYLKEFQLTSPQLSLPFAEFSSPPGPPAGERNGAYPSTRIEYEIIDGQSYPKFINEFWTSKQRQAAALQEVAYRACFKPQLPRFFIKLLTQEGDRIYDPFSGRGTTIIEAGILGRNVAANDVNPLSKILSFPRFFIPDLQALEDRLAEIPYQPQANADIDLSMFYHPDTEAEIVSLKEYLRERAQRDREDHLDAWIRMVATNRLTGHSSGFFSVYTLPPNQAIAAERQTRINQQRKQKPEYRDTKRLILKKSKQLISGLSKTKIAELKKIGQNALFLCRDARNTSDIADESIQLTVTSPPFLNVVQYAADNWLRCWFNSIDAEAVGSHITMAKTIDQWSAVMGEVFKELFRITKPNGWLAFEVGEVKNGKIKLDEYVVPLGIKSGFSCKGTIINEQEFTKTANIWGVDNNTKGTNSNRIVLFHKSSA